MSLNYTKLRGSLATHSQSFMAFGDNDDLYVNTANVCSIEKLKTGGCNLRINFAINSYKTILYSDIAKCQQHLDRIKKLVP